MCVKFDHHVLAALDAECNAIGIKRNRLINEACDAYLKEKDRKRLEACGCL